MGMSRAKALSRTTLLLNEQLLGGRGDNDRIADLLAEFTVQIVADAQVAATRVGQELILSSNLLIRRMGMAVHVDVADAPLVASAPPYEGATLHGALLGVTDELIPDTRFAIGPRRSSQITFLVGSSSHTGAEPALRVSVRGLRATIRPATDAVATVDADSVLAALAASGCIASQSLRAFLPTLAEAFGIEIRSHSFELHHEIEIDLEELFPGLGDLRPDELGRLDFISAGAITNASLYTLIRLKGLDADARVIEREDVDLSNLNRYMLALFSHLGRLKIRVLERFRTAAFRITGAGELFTDESRSRLLPLAPRVLVGVDHVRSRWAVQRDDPRWLCVGATEGFDALVSTHRPGQPCAGCMHPFPNDDRVEIIPTISFVSFFAGYLQALALLVEAAAAETDGQVLHCMAFGWEKPVIVRMRLAPQTQCPVCGNASDSAESA